MIELLLQEHYLIVTANTAVADITVPDISSAADTAIATEIAAYIPATSKIYQPRPS